MCKCTNVRYLLLQFCFILQMPHTTHAQANVRPALHEAIAPLEKGKNDEENTVKFLPKVYVPINQTST